MVNFRITPSLLLQNRAFIKGKKFRKHRYVGDPINTIRLYNDKGADEVVILDIGATKDKRDPDYHFIEEIASEAFMPMAYGGGITSVQQAKRVISSGYEKIIVGSSAVRTPSLISDLANSIGSQSVCVCIDYSQSLLLKHRVVYHCGKKKTSFTPQEFAKTMENSGAGEILLQCVDRDGTRKGYDIDTLQKVVNEVAIPVVVLGGSNSQEDLNAARLAGASAAAAGSQFVFVGNHQGVLINYPNESSLNFVRGEL